MHTRFSRTGDAIRLLAKLQEATPLGEKIGTKSELQEQCGVSKGTFNEAVRLLEAQGRIKTRPGPGGGIFASQPSPIAQLGQSILELNADAASVQDAIRIRDALDPLLVHDATEHSSAADHATLRAAIDTMRELTNKPVEFTRANWNLHAEIAKISPNLLLSSIYVNLLNLLETATVNVLPTQENPLEEFIEQRLELHSELVEAICRGDAENAARLIELHNTSN